MRDRPSWDDSDVKAYLKTRVPNAQTSNDSLVTVVVRAALLSDYVNWMQDQEEAKIADFKRQILNNSPSIVGYTGLANQINTLSVGTTAQNYAANYVKQRYNLLIQQRENSLTNQITMGGDFIWY